MNAEMQEGYLMAQLLPAFTNRARVEAIGPNSRGIREMDIILYRTGAESNHTGPLDVGGTSRILHINDVLAVLRPNT